MSNVTAKIIDAYLNKLDLPRVYSDGRPVTIPMDKISIIDATLSHLADQQAMGNLSSTMTYHQWTKECMVTLAGYLFVEVSPQRWEIIKSDCRDYLDKCRWDKIFAPVNAMSKKQRSRVRRQIIDYCEKSLNSERDKQRWRREVETAVDRRNYFARKPANASPELTEAFLIAGRMGIFRLTAR